MSDVMLFGVLRMPYEMAMSNELSRRQFYGRAQEAADRIEALEAEVEKLRAELSERDSAPRAEPAGQHKFGTPETLDEKALNALLWFYRRMVNAYGRLPFAEEAIAGLRARIVATRCRAEGGNTSETASARLVPKGAETRMDTSFCASASSAPAARTEKDAERLLIVARDALEAMLAQFTRTPSTLADTTTRGQAHAALADILAHTKAREGA